MFHPTQILPVGPALTLGQAAPTDILSAFQGPYLGIRYPCGRTHHPVGLLKTLVEFGSSRTVLLKLPLAPGQCTIPGTQVSPSLLPYMSQSYQFI